MKLWSVWLKKGDTFVKVGEGEGDTVEKLEAALWAIDAKDKIRPGDLIAHQKSWKTQDAAGNWRFRPTHIVIVDKEPTRDADKKITAIEVIEAVGYDDTDEAVNRMKDQVKSDERTRRTEYLGTYLKFKGLTFGTDTEKPKEIPYVGKFWVLRFKE